MVWPHVKASVDLCGRWLIAPGGEVAPAAGRPIDLPCAWQTWLGTDFHGTAWLHRRVPVPAQSCENGARTWLRFESVATDLRAFVNGREVGRHVGDWVPFQLEVSDAAAGAATGADLDIALRVDEIRAEPLGPPALQKGHITKGFHDVISLQHGGVWQPLRLDVTGPLAAVPDGVAVLADPQAAQATAIVELEPHGRAGGHLEVTIADASGGPCAAGSAPINAGDTHLSLTLSVARPRLWSPQDPYLYRAAVRLIDDRGARSEAHELRFGFRTVRAEGRTILLNEQPLFVRGVLDWGHAPHTIAPAAGPDETRATFARLRALGFNCVCHCMWYPPRHVFEIADETGMLIWQEHPVWQSPMESEHRPEYQRLYRQFLRRDRQHPSVIIVSATCEHPCFDRELSEWWWRTARAMLPRTLLQTQTAFFKWTDPSRTDLHDEHTYDNCNRWVSYVEDLREHLEAMPPKPFVMGESILFTSWPDLPALARRAGGERPWWLPRAFEHMVALEAAWSARYGHATVERFRRQGDRFHRLGRQFQVEQLRRFAGSAGVVMNHVRDVPQCQCGFMDDCDRWRFQPRQCSGWLADRALLLWTADHRRAFRGGDGRSTSAIECNLAVSNFCGAAFDGSVRLELGAGGLLETARLRCGKGDVASVPVAIPCPPVTAPTRMHVEATAEGAPANCWDLWIVPARGLVAGAYRLQGWPFTPEDSQLDEVERGYSRGYGLPVRRWKSVLPDPAALAGDVPAWDGTAAPPRDARVLLTHRLIGPVIDWLISGGRVILCASKAPGAIGTVYESLFGQVPLVVEEGPLRSGESECLVDLLLYDLIRRSGRVIPVENLGIADQVDPIVRAVFTHDSRQRVRLFDQLFMARVGRGLLIVTSLDHGEDGGQWLLGRLLEFAAGSGASTAAELDPALVRRWTMGA